MVFHFLNHLCSLICFKKKCRDAATYFALQSLNTRNRVLLTGTPLQNSMSELWSLLHFLHPDIFCNLDEFTNRYSAIRFVDTQKDEESKEALQKEIDHMVELESELEELLKPHLLRRVKADVLRNLPQKFQYVIPVTMTEIQRRFDLVFFSPITLCLIHYNEFI